VISLCLCSEKCIVSPSDCEVSIISVEHFSFFQFVVLVFQLIELLLVSSLSSVTFLANKADIIVRKKKL